MYMYNIMYAVTLCAILDMCAYVCMPCACTCMYKKFCVINLAFLHTCDVHAYFNVNMCIICYNSISVQPFKNLQSILYIAGPPAGTKLTARKFAVSFNETT